MQDLKKIIATAIATGSIVTAASVGVDRANCDYVITHEGKDICVSEELKEAVESQLQPNAGFGGVTFGK